MTDTLEQQVLEIIIGVWSDKGKKFGEMAKQITALLPPVVETLTTPCSGDAHTYDPMFKIGYCFRPYPNLSTRHPNNPLYHIRAFVDGEMICCHWVNHKRRWYYTHVSVFDTMYLEQIIVKKSSKTLEFIK